jgi:aspartyl-tRNA(Asn)/glutamyl-tRNA(Gln) amidotransferase subunit B
MELVTEPVIGSAREAADFARELQLLLRYLGASGANMEKGEMRVEANVSVARATETADGRGPNADRRGKLGLNRSSGMVGRTGLGAKPVLGTKVEVKNLNSFRAVERAIAYEMNRQVELLESGGKIVQETRGWNEDTGKTFSQRRKEESHDYRYFPDPDLPKLVIRDIPEFAEEKLRKEMPELPSARRHRYAALGVGTRDVETLLTNRSLGALLEATAKEFRNASKTLLAANYITSDLLGLIKKAGHSGDAMTLHFSAALFAWTHWRRSCAEDCPSAANPSNRKADT